MIYTKCLWFHSKNFVLFVEGGGSIRKEFKVCEKIIVY